MTTTEFKLGETLRGPEDLDLLWINLGVSPLYDLGAGMIVYTHHSIVSFVIGRVHDEQSRAKLAKEIARISPRIGKLLVIEVDDKAWEDISAASEWDGDQVPESMEVPVLDVQGQPYGKIRMNSIGELNDACEHGMAVRMPVLAYELREGNFFSTWQIDEKRHRLVFRALADFDREAGGVLFERTTVGFENSEEPVVMDLRYNELIYLLPSFEPKD